jgi:stage III sporulation protein AA
VINFLPKNIADILNRIPPSQQEEIEEIRIRINRQIEISMNGRIVFLPYVVQQEDSFHLMNKISHFSIYAIEDIANTDINASNMILGSTRLTQLNAAEVKH